MLCGADDTRCHVWHACVLACRATCALYPAQANVIGAPVCACGVCLSVSLGVVMPRVSVGLGTIRG